MLAGGSIAPDFRLPVAGGGEQTLSDILKLGPALLAFYKVNCPTCQFTFPYLQRLSSRIPPDKLQVFGIAQNEARSVAGFAREFGIAFPSLLDDSAEGFPVSDAYGIHNVPSLFLVETDRRIAASISGFVRADIAAIGERFGVTVFSPGERVPETRPG